MTHPESRPQNAAPEPTARLSGLSTSEVLTSRMSPTETWHLVTGEYPPQPGGVADYTALLAAALAKTGADVQIWTSAGPEAPSIPGVTVHRSAGRWSLEDLRRLDRELDSFSPPRRIVAQYAPNAWGYKGMNLGFCRWLLKRRRQGDDVRVMFHEVWYQLEPRDKPARWLLVAVQRIMARTLMKACVCAYVSIPSWESLLRRSESWGRRPVIWLPVPSNIPVVSDPAAVASVREKLTPQAQTLLASFGTFGETIGAMMEQVVPRLMEGRDDRRFVLIGRGSERFIDRLIAAHPALAGRLIATGGMAPTELSAHLQACDLFIQPYPDGISSRRGSLMAGLAHGAAVVSNLGPRSEIVWQESGGVALAAKPDLEAIVHEAESVLASPETLRRLRTAALALYEKQFDLSRTVATMTGSAVAGNSQP